MSVQEILNVIKAFFDALVSIVNAIKSGFQSDGNGESANN